jgi:hypothetical protein
MLFNNQFRNGGMSGEAVEVSNGGSVKALSQTMQFNRLGCCGGGNGSYYYLSLTQTPDFSKDYTFEWTAQNNVHISYVFRFPKPAHLINVPAEVPAGSTHVTLEYDGDNLLPNETIYLTVHYPDSAICLRCGKFDHNTRTTELNISGYSNFAKEMRISLIKVVEYKHQKEGGSLEASASFKAKPVSILIRQ